MKQKLFLVIKLGLALGLIVWMVQSDRLDFSSLGILMSPQYLIPCLFLTGVGIYLCIERWRVLLFSQSILLSRLRTTQLVLIGIFFNYFMPGGVGGDVIKGFYIAREFPESKTKVIIAVLMDRIVGLFSMILLAMAMMLWQWQTISESPQLKMIFTLLCFLLLAFIAFWSVIFSDKLEKTNIINKIVSFLPGKNSINKVLLSLTSYRQDKKSFGIALTLSLVAQVSAVIFFYVAGQSLGFTEVAFSTYLFVVPIGFMIQAIPIAPAGIGVGQAGFLFLFTLALKEQNSLGPSTITAFQVATFFYGIIGAFCYLSISRKMKTASSSLQTAGDNR